MHCCTCVPPPVWCVALFIAIIWLEDRVNVKEEEEEEGHDFGIWKRTRLFTFSSSSSTGTGTDRPRELLRTNVRNGETRAGDLFLFLFLCSFCKCHSCLQTCDVDRHSPPRCCCCCWIEKKQTFLFFSFQFAVPPPPPPPPPAHNAVAVQHTVNKFKVHSLLLLLRVLLLLDWFSWDTAHT